jgi:hypothetical protein
MGKKRQCPSKHRHSQSPAFKAKGKKDSINQIRKTAGWSNDRLLYLKAILIHHSPKQWTKATLGDAMGANKETFNVKIFSARDPSILLNRAFSPQHRLPFDKAQSLPYRFRNF